jgi:FkbM family methyltransferase
MQTKQGFFGTFYPNDIIQNRLIIYGEWEPVMSLIAIEYLKKNSGTVLDFGAHIGTFSIHVALNSNGTVVGVECQPSAFTQFSANIILNKLNNLIPLLVTISDSFEIVDIDIIDPKKTSNAGNFSLKYNNNTFSSLGKYPSIAFNPYLIISTYSPTVVKIDLEGLDYLVLESLIKYLNTNYALPRPLVIAEEMTEENITQMKGLCYQVFKYKSLYICYPTDNIIHLKLTLPVHLVRI